MGRLLEEWAPVFDAKVLPLLDPITLAVFKRVGEACRDAVLRSPDLPCAGRTVGVEFMGEEFVESVKLLAWAKVNGCRWDEHTCAAVAKGGRLEVLRWAREQDCPWDERTCAAAAANGYQDVLQWAWERGCPWDPYTLHALREGCPELRALWDEAAPVTEWRGVIFGEAGSADAGRVVAMNLMNKGLMGAGKDLAELGGLTALKALSLDGNQLTSVPEELGGLTSLRTLFLHNNQLTSVPAALETGGALEQSGCEVYR